MSQIIVRGNPIDGFDFIGPFLNGLDAVTYIDGERSTQNMWTAALISPAPVDEVPDEELINNDFGIIIQSLGPIDNETGKDQYFLLTRKDGENLTPEFAERWLHPRVYKECKGPGTWFCDRVTAMQKGHTLTQCICVVEHRRDI